MWIDELSDEELFDYYRFLVYYTKVNQNVELNDVKDELLKRGYHYCENTFDYRGE